MAVLQRCVVGSWAMAALGSAANAPPGKWTKPPACWRSPVPLACELIAGKSPASSEMFGADAVGLSGAVTVREGLGLAVLAGPAAVGGAPHAVSSTTVKRARYLTSFETLAGPSPLRLRGELHKPKATIGSYPAGDVDRRPQPGPGSHRDLRRGASGGRGGRGPSVAAPHGGTTPGDRGLRRQVVTTNSGTGAARPRIAGGRRSGGGRSRLPPQPLALNEAK